MRKDPDKKRTTSVTAYLSNRRKLALGILAGRIAGGSIAQLVTDSLNKSYGQELDAIELTIFIPGSSDETKEDASDEKEDSRFVA